jgi:hypothetical protein
MKAGIALLGKLDIIEFAVQAAITGDDGPLTSSPNQRRNMALLLADVASTFAIIATRIDPLACADEMDNGVRWEAARDLKNQNPRIFALPDGAFEASMERVGTEEYLAESKG